MAGEQTPTLEKFFDQEIEPKAICANCDYFEPSVGGVSSCLCRGSGHGSPEPTDTCIKFFPDRARWPEADHD